MSCSRPGPRWSLLAVLLLAPACASVPAAVEDAKNLRISYVDYRTQSELGLVNETHPEYQDLYSRPRTNAVVKLAPEQTLQELVDFAAAHDFFQYAEPLDASGRPPRQDAFRMIVIEGDDAAYALVLAPGVGEASRDLVQAFTDVQAELLGVYNSVQQLQYISTTGGGGKDFFEKEQERLRQENLEQMKKRGGGR